MPKKVSEEAQAKGPMLTQKYLEVKKLLLHHPQAAYIILGKYKEPA